MIRFDLVAALGVATSVLACGTDTTTRDSVGPHASMNGTTSETTSARPSETASSSSSEVSTTDNTSTMTSETTDQSSSLNDVTSTSVTSTSVTSTAPQVTSDLTSGETSSNATSSSSSDGTTSDVPTSAGTLRLTSPVLQGSSECTAATPAGCNVFQNDNISYMDNANMSPMLEWSGVPEGTLSFAVTLRDVSYGQPLWAIWNIPGSATGLPADLPKDTAMLAMPTGAEQSNASFADGDGYYGPQAPCNVFEFTLFALSIASFEPDFKDSAAEVDAQLNVLGEALLDRTTLAGRTKYNDTCDM